jgi:hypothetical protein
MFALTACDGGPGEGKAFSPSLTECHRRQLATARGGQLALPRRRRRLMLLKPGPVVISNASSQQPEG